MPVGGQIEFRALPIQTEAQLMRAEKAHGGKIRIRHPLLAARPAREVDEVISPLSRRKDLKNLVALRALSRKPGRDGYTHLGQGPVVKINLILRRGEVQILPPVDGGLDGIEKGESIAVFVDKVHEQAAGKDIRGREIHLQARQIAAGQSAAAVLAPRQPADRIHAVEAVEGVVEPRPALGDGSGDFDARRPFFEMQAALGVEAGDKVGGAESPAVVAHSGLDIHRSGRSASFVGGVARAVDVDGTHGFDIQVRLEAAAERIGNIEAIESEVGLVGGAAVEMQAAADILHDALEQRHGVSQVLRGRVGRLQDFDVGELLLVGGLLRVDGGG